MKLIDITCPKCKATMKVDKKKKELNCEFCGNKILVDDEIKKVKILHAGQITEEQEFNNAEANLKFKDYEKAYIEYKNLSIRYADNKEIWLGLLKSSTEDFTKREYNPKYEEYFHKYESLANEQEIIKYKRKYDEYINTFSEKDKKEVLKKQKKLKNKSKIFLLFPIIIFLMVAIIMISIIFKISHTFIKNDTLTDTQKTKEKYETEINNLQTEIDKEYNNIKTEYEDLKEELKPTQNKITELKRKQQSEFMKNGHSKKYYNYEDEIASLKDSISEKESMLTTYKRCIENEICSSKKITSIQNYDNLVSKKSKLESEMNNLYN